MRSIFTRCAFVAFAAISLAACGADSATAPLVATPPAAVPKQNFVMAEISDGTNGMGYQVGVQSTSAANQSFNPQQNVYGNTVYTVQKAGETVMLSELVSGLMVIGRSVVVGGKLHVDTSAASPVRVRSYLNVVHEAREQLYIDQNGVAQLYNVGDTTKIYKSATAAQQTFMLSAINPTISSLDHGFGLELECVKAGTVFVTVEIEPTMHVNFNNGGSYSYNFIPTRLIEIVCYAGESLPSSIRDALDNQKLRSVRPNSSDANRL